MRRSIPLLLLSLSLLAAACGGGGGGDDGGESAGGASGDEIVIAIEGEPGSLDPQLTLDGGMKRISENIVERLIDRDLNDPATLVPQLATELPTQVDDTTWELPTREGVTFTNGEPFNAEAAAAAINRMIDPVFDSELLSQIETIESAEAVDENTLRITTNGPDPVLPARLYMIPMVPPEAAAGDDFGQNPVGTGPYELASWDVGESVELVVNEDYWGEAPEIERVRFRFMAENQSRVAALQSGEIHLATGIVSESGEDVPQLITRDGIEYPFIRLKTYEGPLQDVRVRQAMAHALDVPGYIETLYGGNATQANCQINGPGVFGYNPDLEPYEYDPDRAQELLEEAGYAGEEIRITAPTDRWPKFDEMAETIDADLEAVGFNINMELMLFDPWLDEFIQSREEGQPDGSLVAASNELQDGDRIAPFIGESGSVSSTVAPELETALAAARTELDPTTREQAYQDIYETVCDEVLMLPLLTFQDIYGAVEELEWTPRFDGTTRAAEMSFAS